MPRPPDSRVSAGQALEDEADAITDSIRRQAVEWSGKMMRGHPGNARIQAAFVAGLVGASMDLMGEAMGGDYARAAQALQNNLDAYLSAMTDDAAQDAEPITRQEKPHAES